MNTINTLSTDKKLMFHVMWREEQFDENIKAIPQFSFVTEYVSCSLPKLIEIFAKETGETVAEYKVQFDEAEEFYSIYVRCGDRVGFRMIAAHDAN